MSVQPKIIVALDYATEQEVLDFLPKLDPKLCRVKIGSTLFTHYGPSLIEKIQQRGFSIFLDLKFHDIPQQVAGACRAAAELGVWMVNVHVSGGLAMMQAAREAINQFPAAQRPLLIGVTVLTSLNDSDLTQISYALPVAVTVEHFAKLAERAQLDGVVCSAHEAACLRMIVPPQFLLVTPGIRLPEDSADDQKRLMTPPAAIAAGASYLVVGRSITQAKDPIAVMQRIISEIGVTP